MKNIIPLIICFSLLYACNEEKFLEETPLDFLSANDAYETENDL